MAVVAPIPSANVRMATRVKPGFLRRSRNAKREFCSSVVIFLNPSTRTAMPPSDPPSPHGARGCSWPPKPLPSAAGQQQEMFLDHSDLLQTTCWKECESRQGKQQIQGQSL